MNAGNSTLGSKRVLGAKEQSGSDTAPLEGFVGVPATTRSLLLGELIDRLGPRTVTRLGRADPNRLVLGTEFHDPIEEPIDQAGTLLIVSAAPGMPESELQTLAARAAELGYAAICVKCFDESVPTFSAISETSGLPILRVANRIGWRLFEALVGGLLGEQRSGGEAHLDRSAEPLFALANELASYFGGSVAIEDLGRRIVAYSSVPGQLIDTLRTRGILERRVPRSPTNDDEYREVFRSEDPVKFPQLADEYPRVAYAIRAGTLPLGSIWAIDAAGEDPVTPGQSERMRRAGAIAAAYMLDDIRVREAGQAPREERLRTLLTGSDVVGTELAELGVPEERGAQLLVFDLGYDEHPTTLAQLRSTVQRHLSLHRPEATTVVRAGRVYSLIAHEEPAQLARIVDPLLPIIDRLIGKGTGRRGGIRLAAPGTAHRAGGVGELREQADRLLDTASRWPEAASSRILTIDRLRPQLLLERVRELLEHDATLLDPGVSALAAEQPVVAEAVLRWCEAFGNVAQAAKAAGVHENTIRHRLRRAEERYGLALGDPDSLISVWVQLRLRLQSPRDEAPQSKMNV